MGKTLIKVPSREQLLETFNVIKKSKYKGVQGVVVFKSKNNGPTLGITIQTHGNEPSGLAVLWYFLNVNHLEDILQKGTVIFVVNNIKATEKYFLSKTIKEKRGSRFIDVNFNRLPKNAMSIKSEDRYEINRAQELKKVWKEFNVGLDIHSTTQESEPMIIAINKFEKNLVKGFPIKVVLSNIEKIQLGVPASIFYGGDNDTPVLGIESGSHENPRSFQIAISCVICLMQNINLIQKRVGSKVKIKYLLYKVVGSLIFPNTTYSLKKIYPMFGKITKGEILAIGDGGYMYASLNGHIIFGPKQLKPDSVTEEVLFFTESPKKLLV